MHLRCVAAATGAVERGLLRHTASICFLFLPARRRRGVSVRRRSREAGSDPLTNQQGAALQGIKMEGDKERREIQCWLPVQSSLQSFTYWSLIHEEDIKVREHTPTMMREIIWTLMFYIGSHHDIDWCQLNLLEFRDTGLGRGAGVFSFFNFITQNRHNGIGLPALPGIITLEVVMRSRGGKDAM